MVIVGRTIVMAAILAAAACAAGCVDDSDPNRRYPLALRWSFIDGRTCSEAGVVRLELHLDGSEVVRAALGDCEAGRVGAPGALAQPVGDVPAGEHNFLLDALTSAGATLYRGQATADAAERPELDVVLYYQGG